jgi:hypothetical protein
MHESAPYLNVARNLKANKIARLWGMMSPGHATGVCTATPAVDVRSLTSLRNREREG